MQNNYLAAVAIPSTPHPLHESADIAVSKWISLGLFDTKQKSLAAIHEFTQGNEIDCYCVTSDVTHPFYSKLQNKSHVGAV